jgi:hypothetical protein
MSFESIDRPTDEDAAMEGVEDQTFALMWAAIKRQYARVCCALGRKHALL